MLLVATELTEGNPLKLGDGVQFASSEVTLYSTNRPDFLCPESVYVQDI